MNAIETIPEPTPRLSQRMQRSARLVLVVVLLGLGLWTIRNFLPAVIWACILAIAIWPLYRRAQAGGMRDRHNIVLPALFTVAVAVLFGLPFIILAVQGAQEAHEVVMMIQKATTSGIPVPDWVSHLPFGSEAVTHWWQDNLASPVPTADILRRVDRGSALELGRKFGGEVAHRTIIFFFMLMTLFFVLRDGDGIVRDLLTASNKLFGERGERIALQMVSSVHGTVDGLVLVGLGEGLLMGILYAFMGVPHPTLLGGLTAVGAMIPFAVFFVFVAVALLLLVQGAMIKAAVVVGIGAIMVFAADHLVRPALIGGATRLPFLWVLFGILGGVETWGIVGLFIGPALMAALIMLWRDFTQGEASPAEPARRVATPS